MNAELEEWGEVMVDTYSMYAYIRAASQNLEEAEEVLWASNEVDKDELYKRLLGARMYVEKALKELMGSEEKYDH